MTFPVNLCPTESNASALNRNIDVCVSADKATAV